MSTWLNRFQPWGVLCLRIALGASMLYHGYDKVIPKGGLHAVHPLSALDHYSHFIVTLGLPFSLGYVSALTEFIGGIFLILGLFTRFAAFMIAGNMAVALLMVNVRHGYSASEQTLALVAIGVMLLFIGPGIFALDRKFGFA